MRDKANVHGDAELIRRCARGEEAAYRELVERLEKPLVAFIRRYVGDESLAEDLFQETFVRVVRTLGGFKPEASLSTWIFTIARNLCLDHLKAKKRHREVSMDAAVPDGAEREGDFREALRSPTAGPGTAAEGNEEGERLRAAMAELAEPKREALILRVYSDLSYAEIARITDAPVGTVKFRVHDAIQELTKKLGVKKA
ncbi:MAG TPA: sigma-70 family RNA polymerase sigma factor [Planctomycetota bacterium]|nr:sigma-70 family RNA polymerase sigma factor [Planctomycetota bacterium]